MTESGYLPAMLNPFEPGFFDDPYSQYARVRESDPVHRTALGPWALFRYADILRVLRDPNLSVEEDNALPLTQDIDPEIRALIEERRQKYAASMLDRDPPDHHRLRRLVSKVFTPRMIEELRPRIHTIVVEHLDAMAARGGEADVIGDLAFPLPFIVISEMMGIPEGRDRFDLRTWSGQVVKTFDPIITNEETLAAFRASSEIFEFLEEVIAAKRSDPADDLTSALIAAEEDGDRLSTRELVSQIALLFIAGHEATVNLIGNSTQALLLHPEQLALLPRRPVARRQRGRRAAPLRRSGAVHAPHRDRRARGRRAHDRGRRGDHDVPRRGQPRPRDVRPDGRGARCPPCGCEPAPHVRRRLPPLPRQCARAWRRKRRSAG